LVIGVGNPFRCDDAVGVLAARRIHQPCTGIQVVEAYGEGASLMETWKPDDHVVLIDAVRSGSSPGRIHRLDARAQRIPSDFFSYSTHAFSVAEAIEMSRTLGMLPDRFVVYGIEGKNFSAGEELSTDVAGAVDEVVHRVRAEFEAMMAAPTIEVSHA